MMTDTLPCPHRRQTHINLAFSLLQSVIPITIIESDSLELFVVKLNQYYM